MFRKTITALLGFSKNERIGIYLLLLISAGIWILPVFFSRDQIDLDSIQISRIDFDSTSALLTKRKDSLTQRSSRLYSPSQFNKGRTITKTELFSFNPNKTTTEDWIRLGLSERSAHTINNYLSKGGSFKNKEDLKKIYGIPVKLIETIMPFAVFDSPSLSSKNKIESHQMEKKILHLDLNKADSASLTLLPGIGEKLASRIIKYRNKLGGFVELIQLLEVYGLQDSVLIKITPMIFLDDNSPINKIEINTVDYASLSKHPYASFSIAKIIIAFRKAHGRIEVVDDFYNMAGIPRENLDKLIPYCVF